MASRPPLKHITIQDWTPGIADNVGFQWPPGQAQRTNTYRCRASRSGALIPGPKQDYTRSGTDFNGANPTASGKYYCAGIYTPGPLIPSGGGAADAQGRFHEFWIATEYAMLTPTKERRLQRIRQFEAAPTTDLIVTQSLASAADPTSAWGCTFAQTRANSAAATTPGIPVLAIGWGSNAAGGSVVYEYPDDTTPTLNPPFLVSSSPAMITTHQGRFVLRIITAYSRGVGGAWSTTEDLRWAPVNNPHGALSVLQAFYPENTDGYSLMASMSANELFMLKESGGVVAVGDLDSPFITNLPMVPGNASGLGCPGIRAPVGFMYPTQTGLWLWQHGDGAQHMSPNLLGTFWQTGVDEAFLANAYTWCSVSNFVFLSNNFYYDTDTGGFWRLEDPAVMQFRWMANFRNFIYGARASYTHDDLTLIRGYNILSNATSYSFQSFPLMETLDTLVEVREVTLRVKGIGTVAITLTNQNGQTFAKTFTFADASFPHLQQSNVGRGINGSFQGDNITYRIESTGTGGNEAPTVEFLDFGWHEVQRVTTQ